MRLAHVVAFSLVSFAAVGFLAAQDDPPKKEDAKKDDDQGKLVEKKLHVPATYDPSNGTVDVTYDFSDRNQKKDWAPQGLERCVVGNEVASSAAHMDLGNGTDRMGFVLFDALELKGDFTVEWTVKLNFRATTSTIVFLVGAKGGNAFGLQWGDQVVKMLKGGGIQHVTKNESVAEQEFAGARIVELKLERTGDELESFVQKDSRGKRKFNKRELDGKVGILLNNNLKVEVQKFHLKGVISKLK